MGAIGWVEILVILVAFGLLVLPVALGGVLYWAFVVRTRHDHPGAIPPPGSPG